METTNIQLKVLECNAAIQYWLHCTQLNCSRDLAQQVNDLLDNKNDSVDGGVTMKVEDLETDLFDQSVQMRGRESWTDYRTKAVLQC